MLEEPVYPSGAQEQKSYGGANEQGSREKLAWLAGIIDGEGTITIDYKEPGTDKRRTVDKYGSYHARVTIANTDLHLVEAIAKILEEHEFRYYVSLTTNIRVSRPLAKEPRVIATVAITGMKNCIKILDLILPYLVAKRREGELLKEYCVKRFAQLEHKRPIGIRIGTDENGKPIYGMRGTPPNEMGDFYVAAIRAEREKQYDPSETIRRPAYFRLK